MLLQTLRKPIRQGAILRVRWRTHAKNTLDLTTRRWLGMKYLAKVAAAEDEWQQQASLIRAGKERAMFDILEERGLINQVTGDKENLKNTLINRRVGAYVGIDPTAPSLHIGNLVPLMVLYWMFLHGYHTVSLLGGATAKIGDPTDRLSGRKKDPPSVRTANMTCMHVHLKRLWMNVEALGRKYNYKFTWAHHRELINNSSWWNKLTMLEVLQLLGPGMRLGSMLARDTVKQKMCKGDGMSYAEFSYPIMQAWDWWYMFHSKGIQLQIGGSDQFGNIICGLDAIKYILATHPDPEFRSRAKQVGEPLGFTVPLLTTSSGEKLSKSIGNAVSLDSDVTNSFDLYGHFLRIADKDVEKYLKMFTFMPLSNIKNLVEEHMKEPSKRKAQHKLALEIVELAHGFHFAKEAEKQHWLLFHKGPDAVVLADPDKNALAGVTTVNNRPQVNIKLPESLVFQKMFGRVLFAAGFAPSLSEARRLLNASAIYIACMPDGNVNIDIGHVTWSKVLSFDAANLKKYLAYGELLILRKGKHNIRVIQVIPDEEFVSSELKYPGMTQDWIKSVREAMNSRKSGMENERKQIKEVAHVKDLLKEDEEISR